MGWGVPMATDIALAVGVLALAGSGVPATLRAFLLGLAVVDDIGAIVVIAVFYSDGRVVRLARGRRWRRLATVFLAARSRACTQTGRVRRARHGDVVRAARGRRAPHARRRGLGLLTPVHAAASVPS